MPSSPSTQIASLPSSVLSHTSAILDDVAEEVREALYQYDASHTVNSPKSCKTSDETEDVVVSDTSTNNVPDSIMSDLMTVYEELATHRKHVTKLMAKVKQCAVRTDRFLQDNKLQEDGSAVVKKKSNRGRKKGGATGLTKPFPVSPVLCAFIGVPEGTQVARAEVTKYLHQYIEDNGLKDETNGQYIVPDRSLKDLFDLAPDDSERVHIFSMQKRMNAHFKYSPQQTKFTPTSSMLL